MTQTLQPSFTGGEVSKAIQSRIDIAKYATALKICENFYVKAEGGVSNRHGLELIAPCKYRDKRARQLPFQFSLTQTYALEFGDLYMRVIKDGATVLETNQTITALAATAGRQVTISAHGYANDDWVFITGTGTDVDNRFWRVTGATTNTFTLESVLDDTAAPAGESAAAGSCGRVYEIATPYAHTDLSMIRYTQDSDVMNLTHGGYIEQKLSRTGHAAWTIADVDRTISVTAPTNVVARFSVSSEQDALQRYLVSVVHSGGETGGFGNDDGEPARTRYDIGEAGTARDPDAFATLSWVESVDAISYNIYRRKNVAGGAGTIGEYYLIGNVLAGNNEFIDSFIGLGATAVPAGVGGVAPITGLKASTSTPPADDDELKYVVTAVNADTLEESIASDVVSILATLTKSGARVTLTWDAVANIDSYKVYKEISVGAGLFGYIGTSYDEQFTDDNIVPDYDTPPVEVNPFDSANNYPVSVTYHKQRRVYGGTFSKPQTFFGSKTGVYDNMNVSTPARTDDAYTFTIASQEVNAIRHVVSKKNLVIFTSSAEFVANGGENSSNITPANINVDRESTYGSSDLPPLVIGDNILFAESSQPTDTPDLGGAVREFGYEFTSDGYRGNDRTILARHLFRKWKLTAWAWAAKPYHIVWGVREDGELCAMTYLIEHDVWGWHRHVTDGHFEDVCVVREGGEDAVYFIVRREVDGRTQRYIERMRSREYSNIEDAFFVDSGLTLNTLREGLETVTLTGGVDWYPSEELTLTASDSVFDDTMVDKVIKLYTRDPKTLELSNDTRVRVESFVSGTVITVKPIQVIPEGMRGIPAAIWGVATQSVTGLHHLEGKTVSILADGSVQNPRMVVNGTITLDEPSVKTHVGLGYTCLLQTLGASFSPFRSDHTFTKRVNILGVKMKVEESRGFETGARLSAMYPVATRNNENWGEPTALFTGDLNAVIEGDWTDGSFYIRQTDPLPVNINMVMPDVDVSSR